VGASLRKPLQSPPPPHHANAAPLLLPGFRVPPRGVPPLRLPTPTGPGPGPGPGSTQCPSDRSRQHLGRGLHSSISQLNLSRFSH